MNPEDQILNAENRQDDAAPQERPRSAPANQEGEESSEESSRGRGPSSYSRRRNRNQCPFLKDGKCHIDYKDVETLKRYITEEGKIRPRRQTNVCSKCQRALAVAVKRARHLALLPYAPQHNYGD
ncbi:MAG: 30S ribosomal protein S18 [Anaerolineae bacterium]|nr:30S ribosomal protein S18 [Anaerolineae bacterium]